MVDPYDFFLVFISLSGYELIAKDLAIVFKLFALSNTEPGKLGRTKLGIVRSTVMHRQPDGVCSWVRPLNEVFREQQGVRSFLLPFK